MEKSHDSALLNTAFAIALYAFAMAYLESAVVVYLQRALSMSPSTLFPLRDQATLGGLGSIEVGREVATIVMLAAIGWLAGRTSLERFAWTSVAFGIWDIGYYFWLWVFIGWPSSLVTTDLLFLIPVPWVAPVLAPVLVSLALIIFGFIVVRRIRGGGNFIHKPKHWLFLIIGGVVVILSFTFDAGNIRNGGMPSAFAWPVFLVGIVIACYGAATLLRTSKNST